MLKQWYKVWPWLFVILAIVLGFMYLEDGHEWGDDFALYISQARAILEGKIGALKSYNQWSMEHSEGVLGPYLYPQGYPLFLTIYLKFFPFNWVAIKIFQWVIFAFSGMVFYSWVKNNFKLSIAWQSALVSLYLIHPKIIEFSDKIVSDAFFLVLVVAFFNLLFAEDYQKLKTQLLLLIALVLASLTRMNGLLLLFPWILKITLENRSIGSIVKNSGVWIVGVLSIVVLRILDAENESNHVTELVKITPEVLFNNVAFYYNTMGQYLIWHLRGIPFIGFVVATVMLTTLIYGVVKKWIGVKELPVLLFVLANLGIYVLWPIQQGTRFLMPIMPFVALLLFVVWQKFLDQSILGKLNWNSVLGYGFTALFVIQGTATALFGTFKLQTNKVWNLESNQVYAYIEKNVPDSSVISFEKPRWLHLATHKKCIRILSDSFRAKSNYQYQLDFKPGIYANPVNSATGKTIKYRYRDSSQFKLVKDWPQFALYKHK